MKQQTLPEHGYKKYFLYVLNEIVLVVIGILIAIQINNWNDHRKNIGKAKEFIAEMKRDLRSDTSVFGTEVRKIDKLIAYKKWGLQDETNFSDVPNQFLEGLMISQYHNIKINNTTFERLKLSDAYSLSKYASLFKSINHYYTFDQAYLQNFNAWEVDMVRNDLDFWTEQNNFELEMGLMQKDSVGGKQDAVISRREIIKAMNSPQGRNHLKLALIRESTMKSTYERIYKDAVGILAEIDKGKE